MKNFFVIFSVITTLLIAHPAIAQLQSIELTFDGHLCVECELGVHKAIAEKEMGWVNPKYSMDLRGDGKVLITPGSQAQLRLAQIAKTIKHYVIRADLKQITIKATGTIRGNSLAFNDQSVPLEVPNISRYEAKIVTVTGTWLPETKETLGVIQISSLR